MEEMYAGSWSISQRMPHREKMEDYLKSGVDCYIDNKPQDWVLVCFGSYEGVGDRLKAFEDEAREEWRGYS